MAETFSSREVGEDPTRVGTGSPVHMPKVLLAATDRWYATARMGAALAEAGCQVDAVCPAGHPILLTRSVRRAYRYKGLSPLASFSDAIHASSPDLVVPADDLATWHLHEVHERERSRGPVGREFCKLIERSLGAAKGFPVVSSRNAFMQAAKQEGINVPQTAVVANKSDLNDWIVRFGFPMVLKANGTSGGDGVKVVNTVAEAELAFRKLQSPPLLARAVKRALVDHDMTLLWPSLFRKRSIISAQTFVRGHEATSTLFCWKGEVLASLHFEVLEKVGSTGHATVIRRIDHVQISGVAAKVAARLQLSGFHGLDFMIEDETGRAYLIEINPRTTQVGHLVLSGGRDLPAALYSAITGRCPGRYAPRTIESNTVALFPNEWMRDPQSVFLQSAYHDVPWQEAGLLLKCLSGARRQRRWYTDRSKTGVDEQLQPTRVGVPSERMQMSEVLSSEDHSY